MEQSKSKYKTMEERKARVAQLVETFSHNQKYYLTKDYKEAQVRLEFIDSFLECLDWDVKNEQCSKPRDREVVVEDNLKIQSHTKHPDYTLCFDRKRKLYIEAKQPSINLKDNPEPALQVRRYAYTAKMPVAILTDFQEFAVYDTRIKTTPNDTAAVARIEYITFDQYVDKFEELYNKFSWTAIAKGKFNTYYETAKEKRGSESIDNDILIMIEDWRTLLAEDIALHNTGLDEYNLTASIQKIIDRIIFLRICEDKEIEDYNTLGKIAAAKTDIYPQLKKIFAAADTKFNSGLFKSDTFTDNLVIQDKTFSTIISALYYPVCQYEWSVLPVEILGSIYERFLGKIIRFSRKTKNGHSVEVIEKPEVQKAGGVYYTPDYIVHYIAKNTIGKKIAGRTPEQISTMHFIDPACGSGSFLIGAYQYLLNYHLDYYDSDKNRAKALKDGLIYQDQATREYKLSVEEKRRILTSNIYGVDIDAQAVEVTKLSLFLKLLENEGYALSGSVNEMFKASDLAQGKILPDMSNNIKCGNSLIGSDFYNDKDLTLFGMEEQRKVNAFDWEKQFPHIFGGGTPSPCGAHGRAAPPSPRGSAPKTPGFDCVIGNPPYVFARESNEKGMQSDDKNYYYSHFEVAKYQINLYHLFIERGTKLLKTDGLFGYIIPNNWLTINSNKDLREFVLSKSEIAVLNFKYKVFAGADVDTCIVTFANNTETTKIDLYESLEIEKNDLIISTTTDEIKKQKDSLINIDMYKNSAFTEILSKMESKSVELSTISDVKAGLQAYEVGKAIPKQTKEMKEKRVYHSKSKDGEDYFMYLEGNDVKRYQITWENKEWLKYGKNLAAPRSNFDLYATPRILVRQIPSKPPYCINACFTEDVILNDRNSMNIIYIKENPKFILAILNSRAISFWFEHKFGKLSRGIFPQFKINELAMFPIPVSDVSHEPIRVALSSLATQMLDAHKQLAAAKTDADKAMLQQRIEILDTQINQQVYKLYGLTEEEVKVVEGR